MTVPVLKQITPKTITSIGKFNGVLNLSRIFDVVPLAETDEFKLLRIKYEGLVRDSELGGVPIENGTEFKNSITMDIRDKEFDKVRAVKINCEGIHMCGNRSVERSKRISEFVVELIVETQTFMERSVSWAAILSDPHYSKMEQMIRNILPEEQTEESKKLLLDFFREVVHGGGLYQIKSRGGKDFLRIENLRTVMVNYGYGPFQEMQGQDMIKENFLAKLVEEVFERRVLTDFEIRLDYDSHISSIGWSGSVPLKIVHRKTGQVQWLTLQLRRGTIVHSGPNIEIMQKAVDVLFQILFKP